MSWIQAGYILLGLFILNAIHETNKNFFTFQRALGRDVEETLRLLREIRLEIQNLKH